VLAGFAFFNKPSLMGVKAGQLDIETAMMGDTRSAASRRRRGAAPTGEAAPVPAGAGASGDGSPPQRAVGPSSRRQPTNRKRKKRR